MKKQFSILIFLISVFLISCSTSKNVKFISNSLVGKWEFQSLTITNDSNESAISNIMQNSVLEFGKDNSFNFKIAGFERNGVWTLGQKGRALILGYEKTKNNKRLKTFDIIEVSETNFVWNYYFDSKNIELTYKKIQ